MLRLLGVSCFLGCVGCIPAWDPNMLESSDGKVAVGGDETQLSAMLGVQGYRGTGFTKMNARPYDSSLEPGSLINVYVSNAAATAYEEVTPDGNSGGVGFPVGGVLVREVVDANDNPLHLTAMLKREAGFNTVAGDFFFGVTDLTGNPITDGGVLQWGALQVCSSCHAGRSADSFMFGVATADRAVASAAVAQAAALAHAALQAR